MTSLLVAVAWTFVLAGAVAIVAVAGSLFSNWLFSRTAPDRGTLPSHYQGLLHASSGEASGYCPRCETSNGPKDAFCSNCSAPLPTGRRTQRSDGVNDHLLE